MTKISLDPREDICSQEQLTSAEQHHRSSFYRPSSHDHLCQMERMMRGQSVDIGRSLLSIACKRLNSNE